MDKPEGRWIYEFGSYRLDPGAGLLCSRANGRPVPLTPRAYDTLRVLVEHAGQLVDKRTLMATVWPHVVVEENNLDQAISALRQALGERRGDYRYIVTVRGRGYRFAAPVVRRPAGADPNAEAAGPHAEGAGPHVEGAAALDGESRAAIRPRRRFAVGLGGIAAAALALAGALALSSLGRAPEDAEAAPRTLAVLPFRPLTPTDANESLALGMAETLIAGLNGEHLAVSPLS